MKKNKVIKIIKGCVNRLYKDDKALFTRSLCERCLMFRLAYYLQLKFADYFVDCEFNKMLFDENNNKEKMKLMSSNNKLKRIYTDIIIHKRNSKTKDNFICLEIKRTKRLMNNDLERLKMMTDNNGFDYKNKKYIYAYNFGFFIYLLKDKNRCKIKIFEKGEGQKFIDLEMPHFDHRMKTLAKFQN